MLSAGDGNDLRRTVAAQPRMRLRANQLAQFIGLVVSHVENSRWLKETVCLPGGLELRQSRRNAYANDTQRDPSICWARWTGSATSMSSGTFWPWVT